MTIAKHISTVSQTEQLTSDQVINNAGGFVYSISPWKRLERFLILGIEGGTYYCSERKMVRDNAKCIDECFKLDPEKTIKTIVQISDSGRAIKNDWAIFALAYLSQHKIALNAVNAVCRIPTHLTLYAEMVKEFRGWGRGIRNVIANWYLSKDAENLAYMTTKYPNRNGWSHRDLLRKSHPKTDNKKLNDIFYYLTKGELSSNNQVGYLNVVEEIKAMSKLVSITQKDQDKLIRLIVDNNIPREVLPTQCLNNRDIWMALLQNMPYTALLRNLGKMSSLNLFDDNTAMNIVCNKLTSIDALRVARVHPMSIFIALKTYEHGHGQKGKLGWNPNSKILSALHTAFYSAFNCIEPTHKSFLLGVDVSSSMRVALTSNITCAEAAAVMSMVVARKEPSCEILGFCDKLVDLKIRDYDPLEVVCKKVYRLNFGGTDTSLLIKHALEKKSKYDVFLTLTDNETWAGEKHTSTVLDNYRKTVNKNVKNIVAAFTATEFSIAKPGDNKSLDIVGFDPSFPTIISEFVND